MPPGALPTRPTAPRRRRDGAMVFAAVVFVLGAQVLGAVIGVLGWLLWRVTS